jgi:hypothetical protein
MPDISIDLEPFLALADDPLSAAWFLIAHGGWIPLAWFFLWMGKLLWIGSIQGAYVKEKQKPILLAIDVPKMGEKSAQTPKGVENIFAHLAGAHGSHNRREKYWHGNVQEWFSLELVSIEGYIQYFVWTWAKYRDLVETAIYAQYPDAQVTEVQDYTSAVPSHYPDAEWDLFGTEFIALKPAAYPIRTWEEFEHKGQKDEPFKDPLAAMLENMARIGPGEQIWLQFLIKPISQDWVKDSEKVVKKLIGAKVKEAHTFMDTAFEMTDKITGPVLAQMLGPTEAKIKKDEPPSKVLFMSPGERALVELIEKKTNKIGFQTKIRLIYVGKKDVFKKPRGAHAVIGAIKQFNSNDGNGLKPDFKRIGPSSLWLFPNLRNSERKRRLYQAYCKRSMWIGAKTHIFNTEELATLWHFPTEAVHAPLIRRTESKRAEPPTGLPLSVAPTPITPAEPHALPKVEPPSGIPFV